MKVIIVGAGMAGLITGYRLKGNPDIEVTLLEKADRPGGRVGALEIGDGFIVDHSAQFLADNYDRTFQLLEELGIREELEAVDDEHFMCLLRDGQILAFPAGILGFLKTRALRVREKLDLARLFIMALMGGRREAFVRPSLLMKFDGIRLSDYCRQRFARSTLDDVLHPMIAMMMGTPEDVSLLLGVIMLSVVDEKHFVFRHGNGTLPKRLAELCPPIRTETPVKRIAIDGGRVRGVELESGEGMLEADVVVCATNAHEAAEILPDLGEQQLRVLRETPYSCLSAGSSGHRGASPALLGAGYPQKHRHVPDLHHGGDLQEQAQGSAGTRLDPGVHHRGRGQEQDVTGGRRDRRTGPRGDTHTASGLPGAHYLSRSDPP